MPTPIPIDDMENERRNQQKVRGSYIRTHADDKRWLLTAVKQHKFNRQVNNNNNNGYF